MKVQLSLVTTDVERQVHVYNRTRSFEADLPISACPGIEDAMHGTPKAYFEAQIIDGQLHLGQRVKAQPW